jgi:hypothetical protein
MKKTVKALKAKHPPSKPVKRAARASKAAAATVLVLRTCSADLTSYNGFKWPDSGEVSASDWSSKVCCGYGLHGLKWGEGDGGLLCWDASAKWLVVEVPADSLVELNGKVKFPSGRVVYCGEREGATQLIYAARPGVIVGLTAQGQTVATGYRGTATAGYRGTATAGNYGTATAGNYGTATAGYRGTATAGYRGTATAGNYGTATAGEGGTATAGEGGTATAGYRGTATAGEGGTLDLQWYDGKRYRRSIAYVGEGGILPDTKYRLTATGVFEVAP